MSPKMADLIGNVDAIEKYLRVELTGHRGIGDVNTRTMESKAQRLVDEFAELDPYMQQSVRGALRKCLMELRHPSSVWYKEEENEQPPAVELMLFARPEGGVVKAGENKLDVLQMLEAVPANIRASLRAMVLATIGANLGDDDDSKTFLKTGNGTYSVGRLAAESGGIDKAIVNIERFKGPDQAFCFALERVQEGENVEDIKAYLYSAATSSFRREIWKVWANAVRRSRETPIGGQYEPGEKELLEVVERAIQ